MEKFKKGNPINSFKYDTSSQNNLDFFQQTKGNKVIIAFLRYNGCPVCKMEMAEYKRDYAQLDGKNTQLFVVLQSTQEVMQKSEATANFPFTIICDPKGKLFDTFGVEASLMKFLKPQGLIAATKATFKGHLHGKFEGKETQMPAVFVIDENRNITLAHYGNDITDVPPLSALVKYL